MKTILLAQTLLFAVSLNLSVTAMAQNADTDLLLQKAKAKSSAKILPSDSDSLESLRLADKKAASKSQASKINRAKVAGGFGVGNGSDGDDRLPTTDNTSTEVDITVPDSVAVSDAGTLLVSGFAGANQTDDISWSRCLTNDDGSLVKGGCAKVSGYGKLNTPVALKPGVYIVSFSYQYVFVNIRNRNLTEVPLKKIKVLKPSADVNFAGTVIEFNVFFDYSNPEMQDLLRKYTYAQVTDFDLKIIKDNCSQNHTGELPSICKIYASPDESEFGQFFQFDSEARLTHLFIDLSGHQTWTPPSRFYAVDPKAGEFVSVMPGVYGIEFSNPLTGQQAVQYGIHGEE